MGRIIHSAGRLLKSPVGETLIKKAKPIEGMLSNLLGISKKSDEALGITSQNKVIFSNTGGTLDNIPNPTSYSVNTRSKLRHLDNVHAQQDQITKAADNSRLDEHLGKYKEFKGEIAGEAFKRQQGIAKAQKQANVRIENNKSPNAYDRIRRGLEATPGKTIERRAKQWAKNHADPRIRKRLVTMAGYEHRVTPTDLKKGLFQADDPTQILPKGTNKRIAQSDGLEYTVEQHHLISLRDSATIGKEIDKLESPYTAVAIYDYMLNKFGILPGNYDLNIANIAAGPHRLKVGGDLHTWLDRLGYEDYWLDFSQRWAGKTPTPSQILDAFDLYMDEVFYPTMVKLDDLVKKNPTKGEFQGAYMPDYLVDNAYARLRELQKTWDIPRKSRGGTKSLADEQHDLANQLGLDDQGKYFQEYVGEGSNRIALTSRRHYGKGPDSNKITRAELRKAKLLDKDKGIESSGSL